MVVAVSRGGDMAAVTCAHRETCPRAQLCNHTLWRSHKCGKCLRMSPRAQANHCVSGVSEDWTNSGVEKGDGDCGLSTHEDSELLGPGIVEPLSQLHSNKEVLCKNQVLHLQYVLFWLALNPQRNNLVKPPLIYLFIYFLPSPSQFFY